jgi:hypothetical protein
MEIQSVLVAVKVHLLIKYRRVMSLVKSLLSNSLATEKDGIRDNEPSDRTVGSMRISCDNSHVESLIDISIVNRLYSSQQGT